MSKTANKYTKADGEDELKKNKCKSYGFIYFLLVIVFSSFIVYILYE